MAFDKTGLSLLPCARSTQIDGGIKNDQLPPVDKLPLSELQFPERPTKATVQNGVSRVQGSVLAAINEHQELLSPRGIIDPQEEAQSLATLRKTLANILKEPVGYIQISSREGTRHITILDHQGKSLASFVST